MIPQATLPSQVSQASVEDWTWPCDFTALVPSGATLAPNPSVTLTTASGVPVTLVDNPTVSGLVVSQRVRAGLTPNTTYTLVYVATLANSTNALATYTTLVCPF